MSDDRFYFITYYWDNLHTEEKRICNAFSCMHPFDWLLLERKHKNAIYNLITWKEISKREFQKYKNKIG